MPVDAPEMTTAPLSCTVTVGPARSAAMAAAAAATSTARGGPLAAGLRSVPTVVKRGFAAVAAVVPDDESKKSRPAAAAAADDDALPPSVPGLEGRPQPSAAHRPCHRHGRPYGPGTSGPGPEIPDVRRGGQGAGPIGPP